MNHSDYRADSAFSPATTRIRRPTWPSFVGVCLMYRKATPPDVDADGHQDTHTLTKPTRLPISRAQAGWRTLQSPSSSGRDLQIAVWVPRGRTPVLLLDRTP